MCRFVLFLTLLGFQSQAFAQQATWQPRFVLMDIKAYTAGFGNLSNYLGQNVRDKIDDCRAESAMFHFRVNSQGKVDSIRVEGNLREGYRDQIVQNIKSTEGKWQLPSNTKSQDHCWFIYPFFLFGYSYNCPQESIELYQTQKASFDVFGRLKLPTETRYGILLALRVINGPVIR